MKLKRTSVVRALASALRCAAALTVTCSGLSAQTTQSLPAPWSAQDVGGPAIAGSASSDQGAFTISAAGADIWGAADQFHFVYQQVTGDVELIARVDSVTEAHAWSKAGVMVRASLDADSPHGFVLVSAGKGSAFQRRPTVGALSTNTAGAFVAPPYWVRVVRVGTKVTAYSSSDGSTWALIGSDTIALDATAYVGLAVTSHNTTASTTAAISNVSVIPLSVPPPQQWADIGAPALPSTVQYRLGVYTINAGGADVWGTSDQFNYVYQPVSGDFEVSARVDSITLADKWSKAGVMIRETLAADARHAFALASAAKGYAFQRRIDPGGLSVNSAGSLAAPPGWVKLIRTGSLFEAFQSVDGVSWSPMGSDTIPMADAVYVGIATTSHNVTMRTQAVLENFDLVLRRPPNQPPIVSLTEPVDGTTVTAGANVTVAAAASDSDGTIARVDFFVGATPLGSDSTAPYAVTWPSVQAGAYTLTAIAVDSAGASATSAAVAVTVVPPPNQPPAVTLTSPANGTAFTAPATVGLSASASDADGTITRVEFYSGTALLATVTASPYTYTWSGVAAGTYAIRAVAYDDAGASASSATSTITVNAPASGAPTTITFQKSPDHDALVVRYELRIFASGADPATATPIAVSDLGKPAPDANGDITVDRSAFFASLPPGSYVAAVAAIGTAGWTIGEGAPFTR